MPHPTGPRRKNRQIGASFLLKSQLIFFNAFDDFIVAHDELAAASLMARIRRQCALLCFAKFSNTRRRCGVVTVAIDDHDNSSFI